MFKHVLYFEELSLFLFFVNCILVLNLLFVKLLNLISLVGKLCNSVLYNEYFPSFPFQHL